jgi:IstB-like ATP binding protein
MNAALPSSRRICRSSKWTSVFQCQRLTCALLDRLTQHVHILELNGESCRLKQSKARRRCATQPADEAAPATKPRPFPPGRPWYVVLNAHAAKWSVFAPPQRPAFTPPLTGPSCRLPVVSPLECTPRIPGEVPTTSPPAANERNNARLAGCPAGVRPDKRLCHMGDERIELRLRGLGIFHP